MFLVHAAKYGVALRFSCSCTSHLGQCNVSIVLGHRKREVMRLLISPLKSIVNAFLNGQLVTPIEKPRAPCLSCSLLCFVFLVHAAKYRVAFFYSYKSEAIPQFTAKPSLKGAFILPRPLFCEE